MHRLTYFLCLLILAGHAIAADGDPTNVRLDQRDSSGRNQKIDVLGSGNPSKALGFDANGILGALDVLTQLEWNTESAALTALLALKAPLASPTFTGVPAGPTATALTSTTQLATTAFVTGSNTTQDATTVSLLALKAPLASPTFTGTPAAPTATALTSTTQLATTAFVTGANTTQDTATTAAIAAANASEAALRTAADLTKASVVHAHTATDIADSTAIGRQLLSGSIATASLIGRATSGTGSPEVIAVSGSDFSMSGATLSLANAYQPLDADLTTLADGDGSPLTFTNITASGLWNGTGARVLTASAMSGSIVNTALLDQTKTITANTTLTISGTPSSGTLFGCTLTANSSGPYTVTLPAGTWKDAYRGVTITSFSLAASQRIALTMSYDGTNYWMDGVPTNITDSDLSLAVKPAVAVVAVANLTLSGEQTIDGVTTTASLVLATAQSTGSQNGPWVTAAGAWARPGWYTTGSTTQAPQFCTTQVRLGTVYAGTVWRLTTASVTIGTTSATWSRITLGSVLSSSATHSLTFTVDGAGSALTTGVQLPIKTPYGGTLTGYTMMASPSGSVTFNIFRAADTAGLPTASIINSAGGGGGSGTLPAIASGVEGKSTTFTSWGSTTITAFDNLALNLTTVDGTVTKVSFVLYYQ